MPSMRAFATLAALTLSMTGTAAVAAEERLVVVALDWSRSATAEACLDAPTLRRTVESQLGRRVFVARERADVIAAVKLDGGPGAWRADIELQRPDASVLGRRRLSSVAPECSALDDSLALVITLMVDLPASDVEPPAPTPDLPPPPASADAPIRAIAIAPVRATGGPTWRADVAATAALSFGPQPGLAPGLRLVAALHPPSLFRTELELTALAPTSERVAAGGAEFRAWQLGAFACPVAPRAQGASVSVCAGQVLSRLDAEAFGLVDARRQRRLTYGLAVRGRGRMMLAGPLFATVGLGADVLLWRDRFVYRRTSGDKAELFRPFPLAGSADAGLGLSF